MVARRRKVIKEGLKDGLRVWMERRLVLIQRQKDEQYRDYGPGTPGVRGMVRRFTGKGTDQAMDTVGAEKKKAQVRWARKLEDGTKSDEMSRLGAGSANTQGWSGQPTRTHVLGLRKFWEGVIKAAGG